MIDYEAPLFICAICPLLSIERALPVPTQAILRTPNQNSCNRLVQNELIPDQIPAQIALRGLKE